MENPSIKNENTIFLSHSHQDQLVAYGFSEWLVRVWPEIHVYLTHRGLGGREQMQEYSYLHSVPHSAGMLCLLTQYSMTSSAVLDEMEVALKAYIPIVHIMSPSPSEDDLRVYSYLRELWVPKYGEVYYTDSPQNERHLLKALSRILSKPVPNSWEEGMLIKTIDTKRSDPPVGELPIPNVDILEMGKGTKTDALMWVAYLEREHDNQMRIRGLPTVDPGESMVLPNGVRVARLIFTVPRNLWEQPIRQLQLLIDTEMQQWLKLNVTQAPDSQVRELSKALLSEIQAVLGR